MGGAGLGLAIVKEIIRLHNGTIAIDSQPQGWTQVDIHLPRNQMENHIAWQATTIDLFLSWCSDLYSDLKL